MTIYVSEDLSLWTNSLLVYIIFFSLCDLDLNNREMCHECGKAKLAVHTGSIC
jgi:hypothetical protein